MKSKYQQTQKPSPPAAVVSRSYNNQLRQNAETAAPTSQAMSAVSQFLMRMRRSNWIRSSAGGEGGAIGGGAIVAMSDLGRRAGARTAHDDRSEEVDDQGDQEQRETGREQRALTKGRRFVELQGDLRRDRVAGTVEDPDRRLE